MSDLLFLVLSYDWFLFLLKVLLALGVIGTICLLLKFGRGRSRYKDGDLKSAGLNHRERRAWRAIERSKLKRGKRAEKKKNRHF